MLRKITNSFALAFANIRSNIFHTVLSVLGIVIGVAALVSILSLIDGMEEFARNQIAQTTSVNAISISSETHKLVNKVRIRRDTVPYLDYPKYQSLRNSLSKPADAFIRSSVSGEVVLSNGSTVGALLLATGATLEPNTELSSGSSFTDADVQQNQAYAVTNKAFLKTAGWNEDEAIDATLTFRGKNLLIKGVLKGEEIITPKVYFPLTVLPSNELQSSPPEVWIEARQTEDVQALKSDIESWLKKNDPDPEANFRVATNEFRVDQVTRGFLLFRVIMGLIVGISVVVGGIGVMNVLLISVTERTAEIGIRKATGANRKDIMLLFLSESITVSAFGSLLGLVLGVLGTMVIIPIVKAITEAPFQAAYTWNTFMVITILAVLVGIVFGTYPALRASRLNPVEAIRHE